MYLILIHVIKWQAIKKVIFLHFFVKGDNLNWSESLFIVSSPTTKLTDLLLYITVYPLHKSFQPWKIKINITLYLSNKSLNQFNKQLLKSYLILCKVQTCGTSILLKKVITCWHDKHWFTICIDPQILSRKTSSASEHMNTYRFIV